MNPKQKIAERKGVGAHSLTRGTRGGVEGACWSSGIRTRKSDKLYLLTRTCIQPTNKLVSSLSRTPLVLGQTTGNSGLTRLTTARIRGKPPPSPMQYSLRLSAAPTSEWLFVSGLPRKSPKIVSIWTTTTLQAYNFLIKPPIGVRFEANLYLSSRAFQ